MHNVGKIPSLQIIRILVLLVIIGTTIKFASKETDPENPEFELSVNESRLMQKLPVVQQIEFPASPSFLFVDARPKELYIRKHIRGAVNLPSSTLSRTKAKVDELLLHHKSGRVIVYCSGGLTCNDGHKVAMHLVQEGFLDVVVFTGNLDEIDVSNLTEGLFP